MANRPRKHHRKTINITETMKKLLGMTDYVLEQLKNATTETEKYAIVEWQNKCDAFDKIVNYANFIKKPLTLGDFIPCDENGNVLEEPKFFYTEDGLKFLKGKDLEIALSINKKVEQYQQAKSKVFFEGFEILENDGIKTLIVNKIFVKDFSNFNDAFKDWTIERLIPYNPTLTDNFKL